MALTRLGPGKYSYTVDEYIAGLDTDEEKGDSDTSGWFGLVTGDFSPSESDISEFGFNADDIKYLKKHHGALVEEGGDGSVFVHVYTSSSKARADFDAIETEYDEDDDEED